MTRLMKRIAVVGMVITVALVAACTPTGGEPAAPEPTVPDATEPAPVATPAGSGELLPGEVPQAYFDAVVADMQARSGAALESIEVVKSESVVWPDGSLGCPQPGVMYTQALVNGYQVILSDGEQSYDYRLSDSGYFVLCEAGQPAAP